MSLRDHQILLTLLVVLTAGVFLDRALGSDESGIYLFQGCLLSTKSGKAYHPVVRADSRRIHVNTGSSIVRTGYRSPCRPESKMVVTDRLVTVLEMKCQVASVKDKDSGSAQSRLNRVQRKKADPKGNENMSAESSREGEGVRLSCKLLSSEEISGTYGALVIAFDQLDPQTGTRLGRKQVAQMKYIGDLMIEEELELETDFRFDDFSVENAEYSFHLYSRNGEEIALSNSRELRELSAEEYGKLLLVLEGSL